MAQKVKSRGRPSLNARMADVLRERVAAMKPGEPFGTEVALAAECGVTRMTVRKAINALVEEGLVERRAGVGLFVRGKGEVTRRWRGARYSIRVENPDHVEKGVKQIEVDGKTVGSIPAFENGTHTVRVVMG